MKIIQKIKFFLNIIIKISSKLHRYIYNFFQTKNQKRQSIKSSVPFRLNEQPLVIENSADLYRRMKIKDGHKEKLWQKWIYQFFLLEINFYNHFLQRIEREERTRLSIGKEGIIRKRKFSVGWRPTMSMAFPDNDALEENFIRGEISETCAIQDGN